MVTERDVESDELPGERLVDDHLAALIAELIAIVFERIPDTSSAEHRGVMTAVLDLHRQLRARPRSRLLN
jgi:hypothetical protein